MQLHYIHPQQATARLGLRLFLSLEAGKLLVHDLDLIRL